MNEFYIYVLYGYRIPEGVHMDYSDWRGWAGLIMELVFLAWSIWLGSLSSQKKK